MNWLNPVPSAGDVERACPDIRLAACDYAALRAVRVVVYLVRGCQSCALMYGLVSGIVLYPKMGGPIIGVACAWLIGCAMPTMPYQVSEKISKYLSEDS